jgi:hypothetical protein
VVAATAGTVASADDAATLAARNGRQATRALVDSNRIMHAWLKRVDPVTGLLPHRGDFGGRTPDGSWVVANTAADLYPFMVMAARLTEPTVYHGAMLDVLRQETLLTTRVGRLSDDVEAGGAGFTRPAPDLDSIIFGSSEYMKDGDRGRSRGLRIHARWSVGVRGWPGPMARSRTLLRWPDPA